MCKHAACQERPVVKEEQEGCEVAESKENIVSKRSEEMLPEKHLKVVIAIVHPATLCDMFQDA